MDQIQKRIYYDDTDSGGVVYHSHYLRYLEWGRTEFLRSRGITIPQLREQAGVEFAADGLVELAEGSTGVTPGDTVLFLPFNEVH